jgi:hypothetical protein
MPSSGAVPPRGLDTVDGAHHVRLDQPARGEPRGHHRKLQAARSARSPARWRRSACRRRPSPRRGCAASTASWARAPARCPTAAGRGARRSPRRTRHGRDRLDPHALGEVVEEDVAALGDRLDQVDAPVALTLPAVEPAPAELGMPGAVDLLLGLDHARPPARPAPRSSCRWIPAGRGPAWPCWPAVGRGPRSGLSIASG